MSNVSITDETSTSAPKLYLVDWPRHGMKLYRDYLYALHDVGMDIKMVEMMDWGCLVHGLIGHGTEHLEYAINYIYTLYHDRLPRDHDTEKVKCVMDEIVTLLYYEYAICLRAIHPSVGRLSVVRTSNVGMIIERLS